MFRNKFMTIAVVLAGVFLYGCQPQTTDNKSTANTNSAAANTAKASDPKVVDEIKELLAAHDKALNEQDLNGVMATYSTDPKVVLLGTGKGERYVGADAIKNAYTEFFKDYDKGTFVPNCDWKSGGADDSGKMAWLAATCNETDSMKGVKREFVINVTATVVKQDSGWKFISLHMSNLTGGAPPPDAKKTDENKPDAMKPDEKKPEEKKP